MVVSPYLLNVAATRPKTAVISCRNPNFGHFKSGAREMGNDDKAGPRATGTRQSQDEVIISVNVDIESMVSDI